MSALRKYLDRIKPSFGKEGKLHAFRSVYEGFESFLVCSELDGEKRNEYS